MLFAFSLFWAKNFFATTYINGIPSSRGVPLCKIFQFEPLLTPMPSYRPPKSFTNKKIFCQIYNMFLGVFLVADYESDISFSVSIWGVCVYVKFLAKKRPVVVSNRGGLESTNFCTGGLSAKRECYLCKIIFDPKVKMRGTNINVPDSSSLTQKFWHLIYRWNHHLYYRLIYCKHFNSIDLLLISSHFSCLLYAN